MQFIKRFWKLILFVLVTAIVLVIFVLYWQKREKPLTVAFLNIGQGDSIYIKTPSGSNMLVDTGRDRTVLHELSKVMGFTEKHIDTVEISNPDLDHIGGIPFVIDTYNVQTILSPGTTHTTDAFVEIEKKVIKKNIQVLKPKQGNTLLLDKKNNITYTILWPKGNVRDWERNSGSLVGILEYAGKKILLTGDAPKEVEDVVIDTYPELLQNIDILKAGHHGSRTSTGENLINHGNPKLVVISSGKDNRYGHPHKEVLGILEKYNIAYINTADYGRVVCKIWTDKPTVCK